MFKTVFLLTELLLCVPKEKKEKASKTVLGSRKVTFVP